MNVSMIIISYFIKFSRDCGKIILIARSNITIETINNITREWINCNKFITTNNNESHDSVTIRCPPTINIEIYHRCGSFRLLFNDKGRTVPMHYLNYIGIFILSVESFVVIVASRKSSKTRPR